MIYIILNFYIEKEEIIYILECNVKPTYHTSYLSYLFYLSINLDVFNTLINIIHTSSHILVRLSLKDLISNH